MAPAKPSPQPFRVPYFIDQRCLSVPPVSETGRVPFVRALVAFGRAKHGPAWGDAEKKARPLGPRPSSDADEWFSNTWGGIVLTLSPTMSAVEAEKRQAERFAVRHQGHAAALASWDEAHAANLRVAETLTDIRQLLLDKALVGFWRSRRPASGMQLLDLNVIASPGVQIDLLKYGRVYHDRHHHDVFVERSGLESLTSRLAHPPLEIERIALDGLPLPLRIAVVAAIASPGVQAMSVKERARIAEAAWLGAGLPPSATHIDAISHALGTPDFERIGRAKRPRGKP